MEQADVLTTWVKDNGGNVPRVFLDFNLHSGLDISRQPGGENIPTDPNNMMFHLVCETAVMDAIEASPDYTIMEGTRQPFNG
jgi:hypothetical protein